MAGIRNVEMEVEGDMLTIKVDLSKDFGPSSTGKTHIIASTAGPKRVPGGLPISLNMTVFKKPETTGSKSKTPKSKE